MAGEEKYISAIVDHPFLEYAEFTFNSYWKGTFEYLCFCEQGMYIVSVQPELNSGMLLKETLLSLSAEDENFSLTSPGGSSYDRRC